MLTHPFELDIIRTIQQIRSPFFDSFFGFFDYFDRVEYLFVLIPILWLNLGWKTGYKFFFLILLNSFANHEIKQIFQSPRPFHYDGSLAVIHVEGLGFPSGAAQTVILLSMIMLTSWKSSLKWIVVPLYISLVTFARVYMGIHFPTDILGGWCVGLTLFAIYYYLTPILEAQLEKLSAFAVFVLSLAIPFGLISLQPNHIMMKFCMTAIGLSMGTYWIVKAKWNITPSKTPVQFISRSLFGIASCILFFMAVVSRSDSYFLLGLWLSFAAPALILLTDRPAKDTSLSKS